MNDYLTVLGLSMLPALGNFVGGLLVEVFRYSTRTLSLALYAAAGIVLAVIGMELMPQALEAEFPLLMILLFAGGAVFSILIDRGIEHFHRQLKGEESDTPPVMIFLGAAVDLFTDGLIIGTGSTIARELGLLLALAQTPSDVPEGFATIATFKQQGMSRPKRILLSASLMLPVLLGATIGYWAVRSQPAVVKLGVLAFTAGILLRVALDEIIVQARKYRSNQETEEDAGGALALMAGFALFALIDAYFEA
ncbi:MAG TPA: ZIP family metal transporter [Aggregatilineales bacterium]|nr:ZIP family metal transporter [Aggregatilineales bacterium]